MNMKTWLPLALALVLGVAALKLGRDWMAKNKGGEVGPSKTTQIVVAKAGIGAGEPLTTENCTLGQVGTESVPENAFLSLDSIHGRVAQYQMGRNLPIVENLLCPVGTGTGLQAIIPAGMRAISIEINEFSGVGGMLLPGSHVDMIATLQGEAGEMLSRTVVQNVEISAVGQRMVKQPEKKTDEPVVFRSVTLLVTPSEAEAVELAATNGRPRLVLRNSNDKVAAITNGVTTSALRGNPARKNDPAYSSVKVIRGTTETEVHFDVIAVEATAKNTKSTTNTDNKPVTDNGSMLAPAVGH